MSTSVLSNSTISPHLDSVVLPVPHGVLLEPVHLLGVGHPVCHVIVLLVRLVGAGAVVVSSRLILGDPFFSNLGRYLKLFLHLNLLDD